MDNNLYQQILDIVEKADSKMLSEFIKENGNEYITPEVLIKAIDKNEFLLQWELKLRANSKAVNEGVLEKILNVPKINIFHEHLCQLALKENITPNLAKKIISSNDYKILNLLYSKIEPTFIEKDDFKKLYMSKDPKIMYIVFKMDKGQSLDKESLLNVLSTGGTYENLELKRQAFMNADTSIIDEDIIKTAYSCCPQYITKKTGDKFLTKEMLTWAIENEKSQIISQIISDIDIKHIDTNLVDIIYEKEKSLWNSKNILEIIHKRLPVEQISTELLEKSMMTGNEGAALVILSRLDKDKISLSFLEKAVNFKMGKLALDIIDNIDLSTVDNEFIEKIMLCKLQGVASKIIAKTGRTSREFLDKAIEYNLSDSEIGDILNVIEVKDIHIEDFYKFIDMGKNFVADRVLERVESSLIGNKEVTTALELNNTGFKRSVIQRIAPNYLDKSLIERLLLQKDSFAIQLLINRCDAKVLDIDICNKIFKSEEINFYDKLTLVGRIIDRIDTGKLDKEMFFLVYENSVCKKTRFTQENEKKIELFEKVVSKLDESLINKELLDEIIDKQDSRLLTSLSRYDKFMQLILENESEIHSKMLSQEKIENFADQLLNLDKNRGDDILNQQLLLDAYKKTIELSYEQGKLAKDFPIKDFVNIINECKVNIYRNSSINFDRIDREGSFLIMPINSIGHTVSAIVKGIKDETNDKCSMYIVNLGANPSEIGSGKYKEYILKKSDAKTILNQYASLEQSDSTYKMYDTIKRRSIESYDIICDSREQRVGNCFIISLYKGLNFITTAMISNAENKEFTVGSLRKNPGLDNVEVKKVKALRSIYRSKDADTKEFKKLLLESLCEKLPERKQLIEEKFNKYVEKKQNNKVQDMTY